MHNKTIIGFGFRIIAIINKASVCVIRLSLRLRQMTQTLALIIIVIMLNLIQYLLNVNQRGSVLELLFPFASKEHAHAALNTIHKERNKNKKIGGWMKLWRGTCISCLYFLIFICLFPLFALLQPHSCLLWLQSLENCQELRLRSRLYPCKSCLYFHSVKWCRILENFVR